MEKNMGFIDKLIRIILALVIAVFFFQGQITGFAAIVLGVLAVVFILTGIIGVCPLYIPFKFSTKKKNG